MFSNRHQAACELIWERVAHAKRACDPTDTGLRIILQIEQILEMTESRIQDDLEDLRQATEGRLDVSKSPIPPVFHV